MTTARARIQINLDYSRGERSPLLFGHFLEHFHRQIYGGVYDPGSPLADERGFRTDVIEALRRIRPPVIRWPEGCFVSAYHWLDFISIHEYGTGYGLEALSQPEPDYATVVAGGLKPRRRLEQAEHVLGALGLLGTIRIAFDEWNPRGWFHPSFQQPDPNLAERDRNDDNATYTMADAISQACFLNACLRHCQTVGMANFSPVVNTRGAIFTHPAGIVLRSTYHVFDLYVNHTFAEVLNPFYKAPLFTAEVDGEMVLLPHVDTCTTFDRSRRQVAVAVTNLHPDTEITCTIQLPGVALRSEGIVRTVNGGSTDAYNDVARPDAIRITEQILPVGEDSCKVQLAPHSVNVVTLQLG